MDTPFAVWIKDTGERAISTLIQSVIVYLLAAQASDYGNWKAIISAAFPAVGTVLLNALTFRLPLIKSYPLDLTFRIVRTFIVTVLGAILADVSFDLFQATGWRLMFIAGGSSVLVLIKSELAKHKAHTLTPASFALAA